VKIDESKLFPPDPVPTRRRPPTKHARTDRTDRTVILLVAAVAAVGGAFAGGEPAGWPVADALLNGMVAGVLALAGSRARRSTWLWAAGIATIAAPDLLLAGVGLAGLLLAVVAQLLDRRKRVEGAIVLGLAAQVLLRLDDFGIFGTAGIVVLLAGVPALVSAYRVAPRRVKRRVHGFAWGLAAVAALGTAVFLVSAALAANRIEDGVDKANEGLDAARNGEDAAAAEYLEEATQQFDDAHGLMDAWWARPARLVPIIGHQSRAATVATGEGEALAALAARTADQVPVEEMEFDDGRIDLDLVRQSQRPIADTAAALTAAQDHLADVDTQWVLPPLDGRLADLREAVDAAAPDARLAADVVAIAPELLGGDELRRYFVVFTTPAETRGMGGFMGNWAELTAEDGKITLSRDGRSEELNHVAQETRPTVSAEIDGQMDQSMVEYLDRYYALGQWDAIQDVTVSPDFPTVAQVVRQLYPQMGGEELDGVIVVDPYALGALMRFTGPIEVEGVRQRLNHRNAADFLLRDQYLVAGADDRVDLLAEASHEVFERLTSGDLPNPRDVSRHLAPMAEQGRLGIVSFHDDEQELFHRLEIDAAMPPPGPVDSLSVVTANDAHNKIDVYLQRTVEYDVRVDPATGQLQAVARITLENQVPSLDLPRAVIGSNDQGLPPGTNQALLSIYTPHQLLEGTLDGDPVGFRSHRELGYSVYATLVSIPPGGRRVVEVELVGGVGPFDRYELAYRSQPVVNPDEVSVNLDLASGWSISGGDFTPDEGQDVAVASVEAEHDAVLASDVEGP
jgi:hypothetical protein